MKIGNKKTRLVAEYYRYSLIDARYSRALFTKQQWQKLSQERLPVGSNLTFTDQNHDCSSLQPSKTANQIRFIWYPFVYERVRKHRHGSQTHFWAPDIIVPVSIPLMRSADNVWHVTGAPRLARDCLEPNGSSTAVIGSLDDADHFYSANPFPDTDFPNEDSDTPGPSEDGPEGYPGLPQARAYAQALLSAVAKVNIEEVIKGVSYQLAQYEAVVVAETEPSGSNALLRTFDALETLEPHTPCLDRLLAPISLSAEAKVSPYPPANTHVRWGRARSITTLSDQQKSVVGACLHVSEGNTLAIHGPPGTGKTTLLSELIASILVKTALTGEPIPLIALASTNNQAIRNAIDSLSLGVGKREHQEGRLIQQRWIPWSDSLGYYDASMSALEHSSTLKYATLDAMEKMERETPVAEIAMEFIQNARLATQDTDIGTMEEAIFALRRRLKAEAAEQLFCRNLPRQLKSARTTKELKAILGSLKVREARWQSYGWITDRVAAAWRTLTQELASVVRLYEEADRAFADSRRLFDWKQQQHQTDIVARCLSRLKKTNLGAHLLNKRMAQLAQKADSSAPINLRIPTEDPKVQRRRAINALRRLSQSNEIVCWQNKTDQVLDEKARGTWLWLAVHIREGEWLQIMEDRDPMVKDGRTYDRVKAQLYRRSLIAPVLVATLHRLPKILSYWDVQRQAELPLFNTLDWLIVDEAGQCAPDVAAPSVSLTKRLIAIGDLMQLEPVWSVQEREDIGNRIAAGLVDKNQVNGSENRRITQSGGATSSGSLLGLSQHSTQFVAPETKLQSIAKGLWLTEHRRCHPDIAAFFNDLSYQNQLVVKTTDNQQSAFPAICFIDCPGQDEVSGGSRSNLMEGYLIAAWLSENQRQITETYHRPVHECIAILTPFKAQAHHIDAAMTHALGKGHGITCGTVHSLQGAQRPIVMLSLTYSAYPAHKSFFFDRTKSMLNVASSRAQDTLLVVGDLDCLFQGLLPSQMLGKHLVSEGHRLQWPASHNSSEFDRWRSAIRASYGDNAGIKMCAQDSALKMALQDPDINHIILQASEVTPGSLHKMGNLAIAAVRRGATVQWVIPYESVSKHAKSKDIMAGLKIMANNGVIISYSKQSFRNTLILPEEDLAFWAPSSWLADILPSSVIGFQNSIDGVIGRLENVQGVAVSKSKTPEFEAS